MTAPMEVPETHSGRMPASSIACSTPRCAYPNAAPPLRATPTFWAFAPLKAVDNIIMTKTIFFMDINANIHFNGGW